ncbi:MAG: hypothetical protein HY913_14665 [Desulfomonile tiedjei]|nr:hypothetical protein [Desulfomonile tiedjei]
MGRREERGSRGGRFCKNALPGPHPKNSYIFFKEFVAFAMMPMSRSLLALSANFTSTPF